MTLIGQVYPSADAQVRRMRQALRLAGKALQLDEAPVGAIVVLDDVVIGRGYNLRETRQDVCLHAEIIAIRQACRYLGSWRLDGCDLYVTLEPCVMCAGAIIQARIRSVCFGARDPKAGACGSLTDIFALRHNHQVQVTGGLLARESADLLTGFFRRRRQIDKQAGTRGERRNRAIAGLSPSAPSVSGHSPGGRSRPARGPHVDAGADAGVDSADPACLDSNNLDSIK